MPSNFVWYDLMTTDTKAAQAFYTKVVGWRAEDSGLLVRSFFFLLVLVTSSGGLMPISPEARTAGARPFWNGYIHVDDVDAFAKKV